MFSKEHIKLLYRAWKYRKAENNEINYLLKKISKGETAFDVGAHKGAYSFWMKKAVGGNGMLVCFEPQQEGAQLLKKIFKNGNVKIEHLAISGEKGRTRLFIQPQQGISYEASLIDKYENALVEEVAVTTLDDYCRENLVSPSFIKIDVEGLEQNVIAGATGVLKELKPHLLVEIEVRHVGEQDLHQLCNKIIDLGYAAYFFYKNQKVPFKNFSARIHQDIKNIGSNKYSNNFAFEPL